MTWIHVTSVTLFVFGLLLVVHHRALKIGYRQGLGEAINIALRHMNREHKVSRTLHEAIILIEDERDGRTKEQS